MLRALDRHIECLVEIRGQLVASRPARPGERWYMAAASVVAARRYADRLADVLRDVGSDEAPPAGGPGSSDLEAGCPRTTVRRRTP